jgi:hypothetical protein
MVFADVLVRAHDAFDVQVAKDSSDSIARRSPAGVAYANVDLLAADKRYGEGHEKRVAV